VEFRPAALGGHIGQLLAVLCEHEGGNVTRQQFVIIARSSALCASMAVAGACDRANPEKTRQETVEPDRRADEAAQQQKAHADDLARLNERVAEVERKYADKSHEVASGARTPTTGLREEVKEDVTHAKDAVRDLGTTTPENWWERQEQAMARTAEDIETDVRRIAGKSALPAAQPAGTTGDANAAIAAPFTSRRDAFVASLQARVDAMKKALDNVKASGARKTEVTDTRARIDKLDEDIDQIKAASADDWWDVSKARVSGYIERVEDSVGRLDDNKPARE
jgi:hypothetical protein